MARKIMEGKDPVKLLSGIFLLGCIAILQGGCGLEASDRALQKGAELADKGDYAAAMKEFDLAIAKNPNNMNAYYNRALLFHRQGNQKAALADYDKISAMNPNYSEPCYGRGQIYEEEGQLDKAIAEYSKAIEMNVSHGLAHYKRAVAYNTKGEYGKALEDAMQAKESGINVPEDFVKQLQARAARGR